MAPYTKLFCPTARVPHGVGAKREDVSVVPAVRSWMNTDPATGPQPGHTGDKEHPVT